MARRKVGKRARKEKKRRSTSWSLGKKIGAILGGTLLLVATAGVVLVASKMSKLRTISIDKDPNVINISKDAKKTGYLNVALFGVDSRENNELDAGVNSDTIMIASLNNKTGEVKVVSVFRDTLLEQDDGTFSKANAAYAMGGPEEAVAMLNKNLDLDIEHYVTVNFNAMIDVVDAIGGIEIDVQPEEVNHITGYAKEIIKITGKDSIGVSEPGLQTLNGVQATAYARIRATTGDDFRRTERQRAVLEQIIKKAQSANLLTINKIIDQVFPEIATNFSLTEIIAYAKDAMSYKLGQTSSFPQDKTTDTITGYGSVVIPVTIDTNVVKLHEFLFVDDEYTNSSIVSNISDKLVSRVGKRYAMDEVETTSNVAKPSEEEND